MARILVQTNDYQTVLDESDVRPADVSGDQAAGTLLDRFVHAIHDAERKPAQAKRRRVRRLAAIVGTSDYRAVTE